MMHFAPLYAPLLLALPSLAGGPLPGPETAVGPLASAAGAALETGPDAPAGAAADARRVGGVDRGSRAGEAQRGEAQRGDAQNGAAQGPAPAGPKSIYDDPAARARARTDLNLLGRRHGGQAWIEDELDVSVDVWSSLPGLRFDLLETTWINTSPNGAADEDGWEVHSRVPRLVHMEAPATGYLLSEFVLDSERGDDYASAYQRMVADGKVAWAEFAGSAVRAPEAEARARGLVGRELFMGMFPLGLATQKRRIAFLREEQSGELVYMLRFARPLQVAETETAREFALFVDGETGIPLQLQFITLESQGFGDGFNLTLDFDDWRRVPVPEESRVVVRERLIEAWRAANVDAWRASQPAGSTAEPPAEVSGASPAAGSIKVPEELVVPYRRYLGNEFGRQLTELWMEDPLIEALPAGALDRPWISGRTFGHSIRADFWDPPRRSGANSESSDG